MSDQSDTLMSIWDMKPEEPKNVVFSTANCPKCQQLKAWLSSRCIPFVAKDVSEIDASLRTEMILEKGYFPLMVPILRAGEMWLYVDELFGGDQLNNERIEVACQK
jgi:glutaredoxin